MMTGIRMQSVSYSPSAPVSSRTNGRRRATIDASVAGEGIETTGKLLQQWGKSMEKIGDSLMKADGIASKNSSGNLKSVTNPATAGTAAQGEQEDWGAWAGFRTYFGKLYGGN